ncbi:hypothetical protein [Kitasatospora sp. NPDC085879]|uniref:hypothetical protein n=1 Tax=Kitasatospora sp. NPDC085879 TaxID=3154769 RepID=UPI003418B00C
MNHDAIVRARVALLDVRRMTLLQQVTAHRMLAGDTPAVHLPKLSRTLVELAEREVLLPQRARLALLDEAVAAAEAMDAADRYGPAVLAEAREARRTYLRTGELPPRAGGR